MSQDKKRKTLLSYFSSGTAISTPTPSDAAHVPNAAPTPICSDPAPIPNVAPTHIPSTTPTTGTPSATSKFDLATLERDPGLRHPIWKYPPNDRDDIRREYIRLGPCQPQLRKEEYEPTYFGSQRRRFQASWFKTFPWLCADNNKYSELLRDWGIELLNKIRDRCIEKNDKNFSVFIKFCHLIVSCYDKRITVREADLELSNLFDGDPDLYIECTHLLADRWETSDQEPALDYSGFGFLDKKRKVVRRRTLFDKTMAVKEFWLYEMELALSQIQNTIMKLDQDPESFGECLTVHDKRCIMELYKGSDADYSYKGEDLVEILRKDPVRRIVAREVVLERLRQKMVQFEEQNTRLDHDWREIFEDIREKRAVCRHRGFLDQMTELSKNDYSDSD